jgi:hypothetical protein
VLMVKDDRGPDNGNFRGGGGGVPQLSTQGDFSPGVTWCGWGNLVWWNGRRILEVGVVCEIVGVILCGTAYGREPKVWVLGKEALALIECDKLDERGGKL